MKNELFYPHEDDHQIMLKKDRVEVQHWLNSLTYYTHEIDELTQLATQGKLEKKFVDLLTAQQAKNQQILQALTRYEKASMNAWECEDMACESYYLTHHEQQRATVMEHIQNFRKLKKSLFIQFKQVLP